MSKSSNHSGFNNNLKSNQNVYTLDNCNPEFKNSDDYDKDYNKSDGFDINPPSMLNIHIPNKM